MQELIFGNEACIDAIYKGKQNKIPRKKSPSKTKIIDSIDVNNFIIAKGWCKYIDGQLTWDLSKLTKEIKPGIIINLSVKDIDKEYKDNLKLGKKISNLERKLLKISTKKKMNKTDNEKITQIKRDIKILKEQYFIY